MAFLSPSPQHLSQSHLQSLSCGILCRRQCKRKMSRFSPYLQLQQPVSTHLKGVPQNVDFMLPITSKSGREFFWWALTCPAFVCPLNSQSDFCMATPYPGIPLIVPFSLDHLPWPHGQATGYCPWICKKPNMGTFNQCSTLASPLENSMQLSPWRDDPLLPVFPSDSLKTADFPAGYWPFHLRTTINSHPNFLLIPSAAASA